MSHSDTTSVIAKTTLRSTSHSSNPSQNRTIRLDHALVRSAITVIIRCTTANQVAASTARKGLLQIGAKVPEIATQRTAITR